MAINENKYKIPLLKQTESSNCVQTSVSMLLSHYGYKLSPGDIQSKIPVRYDTNNKPYGTLIMDIAIWLKSIEFTVTIDCFDTEIIDRSWKDLSNNQIIDKLNKLKSGDCRTVVSMEVRNILIDGYIEMLAKGVKLRISMLRGELLRDLISKGPFLPIVNYNYLYDSPRDRYVSKGKKYVSDDIEGKTTAHAVIVTGMDERKIYINDPDEKHGGQNTFDIDDIITAIALSQNKAINVILSISQA